MLFGKCHMYYPILTLAKCFDYSSEFHPTMVQTCRYTDRYIDYILMYQVYDSTNVQSTSVFVSHYTKFLHGLSSMTGGVLTIAIIIMVKIICFLGHLL